MAETTLFELVSPERLLVTRPVEMVVVPGAEGYFGVLPRHAPLISTLMPGVIDIYEGGKVVDRIFVAGGFAEVTAERCTVLAEEAVPVAELDRGKLEQAIRNLKDDLADAQDDRARAAIERRIRSREAMLKAAA